MFPKYLYVKTESPGVNEPDFLTATASPAEFAEVNEVVEVAKYQRVEIGSVQAPSEYVGGR